MSYSKDLRERAVRYRLEGHTLEETAKVFGVGKTAVGNWVKKWKETGDLSDKELQRKAKKLPPEKLLAYVEKHPDAFQGEIGKVFGCSDAAVSKAFRRLGITRKKNAPLSGAKPGRGHSLSKQDTGYPKRKDCLYR